MAKKERKTVDLSETDEPRIHVTPVPGASDLTIRHGASLDPADQAPPDIKIDGTLAAPFDFYIRRTTDCPIDEVHLLIDNEAGSLTLNMWDKSPYTSYKITGKLTRNAALGTFRINTDQRWTIKDFKKFIRTVKVYFADRTEVEAMIESLNKFEGSVETIIKQHNDNSGNSLTMLEQKVNGVQLKRKFTLSIPIYKGYEKIKFDVEIGLDPKNTSVDLFLVSDELYEQEILHRETIMADELKKFDKYAFAKVVVS